MNTIALFLAQLSGLQGQAGQNALLPGTDAGVPNGKFLAAVLGDFEQNGQSGLLHTKVVAAPPALEENVAAFLASGKLSGFSPSYIEDGTLFTAADTAAVDPADITLERLNTQVEILRQKIERLGETEQDPTKTPLNLLVLIAGGLSPSQLAALQQNIADLENKLGREITIEDLIAGVGNLIPGSQNDIQTAHTEPIAETAADTENLKPEKPDFARHVLAFLHEQVSVLKPDAEDGGSGDVPVPSVGVFIQTVLLPEKHGDFKTLSLPLCGDLLAGDSCGTDLAEKLAAFLNGFQTDQTGPGQAPLSKAQAGALPHRYAGNPKGQATLPNTGTNAAPAQSRPATGGALPAALVTAQENTPAVFSLSAFQDSNFHPVTDLQSGLPFTNVTQAAHMITQATQHAGQPHPATQMVSARLQQAVQSGQNQTLTLHLEPAELGRVAVRLEFGPDKTLKASLLIEKPETYMMLHRDSFVLERALQDSGLELDGGGLSFELAEDGQTFEHNSNGNGGERGKQDYASGANDGGADGADITLETTMTWAVDPDSGHVHYNILA